MQTTPLNFTQTSERDVKSLFRKNGFNRRTAFKHFLEQVYLDRTTYAYIQGKESSKRTQSEDLKILLQIMHFLKTYIPQKTFIRELKRAYIHFEQNVKDFPLYYVQNMVFFQYKTIDSTT